MEMVFPAWPWRELNLRPRRVDGAEVRHDRTAGHRVQAHREDGRLADRRALRVGGGEGRGAGRADDGDRRPWRCRRTRDRTSPGDAPARRPTPRSRRRRGSAAVTGAIRPGAPASSHRTRPRRGARRRTAGTAGRGGPARTPAGPGRARTSGAARRWRWFSRRRGRRSGRRHARTARRGTRSWARRPPPSRRRTAGTCAPRRHRRWRARRVPAAGVTSVRR